jgi:hypothetical protein
MIIFAVGGTFQAIKASNASASFKWHTAFIGWFNSPGGIVDA